MPYSYYNNLNSIPQPQLPNQSTQAIEQPSRKMLPKMLSKEEEMELLQSKMIVLELKKIL